MGSSGPTNGSDTSIAGAEFIDSRSGGEKERATDMRLKRNVLFVKSSSFRIRLTRENIETLFAQQNARSSLLLRKRAATRS
jgi:hypothetical protein